MISYARAREILTRVAGERGAWGSETVTLDQAMGRILAQDLASPESVPSFDNSAMDGFAVNSMDTFSASPATPLVLNVRGCIAAGETPIRGEFPQGAFDTFEIMTGAPMPFSESAKKWDAVIKIEEVEVTRDREGNAKSIVLRRAVRPSENVRFLGTDFKRGNPLAQKGHVITAESIMALATLGVVKFSVLRRPKVVFLSTGRELVDSNTADLKPGFIRNSSAPFIAAALKSFGVDAKFLGVIADDASEFERALDQALAEKPDVILTTGAVSMGKFDFVAQVLEKKGAQTFFHKVNIRPGKPILFARFGETSFFGVPGNPVSTAVGLRFFVIPFLRDLMGVGKEPALMARLDRAVKKPQGLECFYKARLWVSSDKGQQGQLRVKILSGQESFMVSPLLEANAWAVLPEQRDALKEGELIEVLPLGATLSEGVVIL